MVASSAYPQKVKLIKYHFPLKEKRRVLTIFRIAAKIKTKVGGSWW